jgi:hypothetical protein
MKIWNKIDKALKSNPFGTYKGYYHSTIAKISQELDKYDIRNTTDYHTEHGKYLQVFHNHTGMKKVCNIFLEKDKTVRIEFDNINSYPSKFKYGECFPEAIVDSIINAILVYEGKGDLIKGMK